MTERATPTVLVKPALGDSPNARGTEALHHPDVREGGAPPNPPDTGGGLLFGRGMFHDATWIDLTYKPLETGVGGHPSPQRRVGG